MKVIYSLDPLLFFYAFFIVTRPPRSMLPSSLSQLQAGTTNLISNVKKQPREPHILDLATPFRQTDSKNRIEILTRQFGNTGWPARLCAVEKGRYGNTTHVYLDTTNIIQLSAYKD